MFDRKKMCYFRLKTCLYALTLFAVAGCDEFCLQSHHHSARTPNIPADSIELAFSDAERDVQNQRNKSVRVYPKGLKTAETVHQQENQKPETFQMEARQQIFDEASRRLVSSLDLSPARTTCGLPHIRPTGDAAERALEACISKEGIVCSSTAKYRTADGSCNNLDNPTWGSAFSPVNRQLSPRPTGDGRLRKSVGGEWLPNPRWLSKVLHCTPGKRSNKLNNLYPAFGQFLAHDITFTAQTTTENNEAIQCCPPRTDNHPQCAPIDIPYNATNAANSTCMNFVRSAMYPSCTLGFRTPINAATSFMDGSQIYGNSLEEMNSLRALDGTGKLLVQSSRFGPLLPKSTDPSNDRCSVPQNNQICFRAGDKRVNQNPMLTSMHTIWVREHNRIATKLQLLNPHWKDETLFQEARRIVIAELQHIVLTEYLPLTLGDKYMQSYSYFSYSGNLYINQTNPNVWAEFSTAAFRFGHSMVDSTLAEMPRKLGYHGHLLRDRFSEPFDLHEGKVNLLIMGASRTPAQAVDRSLVPDITEHLYRARGEKAGLDLASLNIQRGRDHALPSYFDVYNLCNPQETIETFFELEELDLMTPETVKALRMAYRDVRNIDLWTGIISEIPVHDGVLGPTGSLIVSAQFERLIRGDRYWYTNWDQSGSFSNNQLDELRWYTSLRRIICTNTNITEMPWNAMQLPSSQNSIWQCSWDNEPTFYSWAEIKP